MKKASPNPLDVFALWYKDAQRREQNDPNAMTLATADGNGIPHARVVLLKSFDRNGFVFFTNRRSRKGRDLDENPHAALCFYWKSLLRQVRLEGRVEELDTPQCDAYFASRPYQSKIGAWASLQSTPLPSLATLRARLMKFETLYPTEDVPRPPHWIGYRLIPKRFEFWEEGEARLHDRLEYTRGKKGWTRRQLYP